MIYYTQGGVRFHFGRDYELSHLENFKYRILQPGDVVVNLYGIRFVLCEKGSESCNVLLNNGKVRLISRNLSLFTV